MRTPSWRRIAILLILPALHPVLGDSHSNDDDEELLVPVAQVEPHGWRKIEADLRAGLPRSAVTQVESLLAKALRRDDYAEATRALGWQVVLEAQVQGGSPEERILRLEQALSDTPVQMHAVLQVLGARWYWQYFQRNRYRFAQRTQGVAARDADLRTWDLTRILREVDGRFKQALADEATLHSIPIAEWNKLLDMGTAPDSIRPTLFDFIAHEALEFYAAGEQGAVVAEDAFRVSADSPLLAPREEFVRWQAPEIDGLQPLLSSVDIFQRLLTLHANDADPTALLEADLDRLQYAYNTVAGTTRISRYNAALEDFVASSTGHPTMARGLSLLATQLNREGDVQGAHRLAKRGHDAFPDSFGGRSCLALIEQIEARSVHIHTERVWNEPSPEIVVNYRNLTSVYFRAVPFQFEPSDISWRIHLGPSDLLRVLRRTPALEWMHELPEDSPFQEQRVAFPVPNNLAPGSYYIIASHDSSFTHENNLVSWQAVWVSDLAVVLQSVNTSNTVHGLVLDARSGRPKHRARVNYWARQENGEIETGQVSTDRDGRFRITAPDNVYVLAQYGKHELGVFGQGRWSRHEERRQGAMLFTDRAIYRPGQTIYFKGLCYSIDQEKNDYEVLSDHEVTVRFRDANNQQIEEMTLRTNDYGSFTGAFTAPSDRLAGRMSLIMQDATQEVSAQVRVEEYKRPSFRVEMEPPSAVMTLGEPVTVHGKATTFSGASVSHAEVRWRVTRGVQFQPYRRHGRGTRGGGTQLAHSIVQTDAEGHFEITFDAEPAAEIDKDRNPIFSFHVHADVIDGAGETQSDAVSIAVGYTTLQVHLGVQSWLTSKRPVELEIRTTSVNGVPQKAHGEVQVFQLQQPSNVVRPAIGGEAAYSRVYGRTSLWGQAGVDTWESGEQAAADSFHTGRGGRSELEITLAAGAYRAVLATMDANGIPIEQQVVFVVVEPGARKFPLAIPHFLAARSWQLEPGDEFEAIWGTGYSRGTAYIEIQHRGRILQSYWTRPGRTQHRIRQKITEDMRGGLVMRVVYVRENRIYHAEQVIQVPWSNKQLDITWEHFRSRLEPGKPETWIARIRDHDSTAAVAEMVACLYDASLDELQSHNWPRRFDLFRRAFTSSRPTFGNLAVQFDPGYRRWPRPRPLPERKFRSFPMEFLHPMVLGRATVARAYPLAGTPAHVTQSVALRAGDVNNVHVRGGRSSEIQVFGLTAGLTRRFATASEDAPVPPPPPLALNRVVARRDMSETAFFFPQLRSDAEGRVRLEFRMPESLTHWNFLAFAHDAELRRGWLQAQAFTSKDFMVEPNPPRFVREGDCIEFTAKISNRTDRLIASKVRLVLRNARTGDVVDKALNNIAPEIDVSLPAGESRNVSWRLTIPDASEFLTYRVVGVADSLSDGEEGYLPVLSRRILVSESLPMPIRGQQEKSFRFRKLLESKGSSTLQHQTLTVQMTSQPAWYAVMALPYLMETRFDCSDQIFGRLYANSLAFHIANSDPNIRRVFDLWKNTPALDSPLQKNQEIKAVMLEETPWLRQAISESRARRNVGMLFDANRLTDQTGRELMRLKKLQGANGMWPWFPGGRPSESLTLQIVTGFGRLQHLGVEVDASLAVRALDALDAWMYGRYRQIVLNGWEDRPGLNPNMALYLYGRSFFLEQKPVADQHQEALDYWLEQAREDWLRLASRQSQAHVALGLQRFGDSTTAQAIVRSLEERSVRDEEMGMFWRDTENAWRWYQAPIETQAMMIEAFHEIATDEEAVDACQVWLLKQKQTQDWRTTRATVDAVYALLMRGPSLLSSNALMEISIGGKRIEPQNVEAGTGFYEERFVRSEIASEMGNITLTRTDEGVGWGSMHWQYLEDISRITPSQNNPLQLEKRLFTKVTTVKGQVLQPVTGPLQVGDELVVRIVLRSDRDLEYVHLKDQRGSGTEPVVSLSRYRWQDGFGYYENPRDTATHFFIDFLRKGTYVFEYSIRVQLRGIYQSGMAQVQCMYAPEFGSHSESIELVVE